MRKRRTDVDRQRHVRAIAFVTVSFALGLVGYLGFGLGHPQTLGYAISVYLALNLLNSQAMFSIQETLKKDID